MKRELADATLAVLAIIILTCLISLMVVFMGGGQASVDLHALMLTQIAAVPVALSIAAAGVWLSISDNGWSRGIERLWLAMPQWLLFTFFLLNSLFGAGEMALLFVKLASHETASWQAHVPLVCMLACTTAFLVLYARTRSFPGSNPAMSGRWPRARQAPEQAQRQA